MPTDTPPPAFPLRDLLGFELEMGEGSATATLDVTEIHINPHGSLHGAVPFTMIDTAMGAATMSVIAEDHFCSTIDITTRYLAPCRSGRITCVATVRRAGRRIAHLDAVVTTEDGTEIVAATGTFVIYPAPTA
ncbi:MAG: PaaI family thioesterase [Ilumatobacter sp.]|nr:PaaI family thioesterase [Acidimicrobiia bacterium]